MLLTLLSLWALETLKCWDHIFWWCVYDGERQGLRGAKVGEVVRIFMNKTFLF